MKKSNFITKSVIEWLKIGANIENPKPLFGSILHQGETAILFASTGVGKSLLANNLADAISKGKSYFDLETTKSVVNVFDFELGTKAFANRFLEEDSNIIDLDECYLRTEINREEIFKADYSLSEILDDIDKVATSSNSEVIIIDNISFLSSSNEQSKDALEFMKCILNISRNKEKPKTILLIAHTPKRDKYSPIELKDLAGSKALSNFSDVVFTIGSSIKGSNIRYIKQLKNRNHKIDFGAENVMECEIVKVKGVLQIIKTGIGSENSHLFRSKKTEQIERVKGLKSQGLNNVAIAEKLGVSEGSIRNYLKS